MDVLKIAESLGCSARNIRYYKTKGIIDDTMTDEEAIAAIKPHRKNGNLSGVANDLGFTRQNLTYYKQRHVINDAMTKEEIKQAIAAYCKQTDTTTHASIDETVALLGISKPQVYWLLNHSTHLKATKNQRGRLVVSRRSIAQVLKMPTVEETAATLGVSVKEVETLLFQGVLRGVARRVTPVSIKQYLKSK